MPLQKISTLTRFEPLRSVLNSSMRGSLLPSLFLPSPSPAFHPIRCSSIIPIPSFSGRALVKVSYQQTADTFQLQSCQQVRIRFNAKLPLVKINVTEPVTKVFFARCFGKRKGAPVTTQPTSQKTEKEDFFGTWVRDDKVVHLFTILFGMFCVARVCTVFDAWWASHQQ